MASLLCRLTSHILIPASCSPIDVRTCISLLQQCAKLKNLQRGREIHSHMLVNGFHKSPPSVTALINMYSKCARVHDAVSVFFFSPDCGDRNAFAYNAMIAGLVANGRAVEALEFYRQMRGLSVLPDNYTLPCVIRACCDLMEVLEVRKIHGLLFKLGLDLNVFVGSALVNTYLKFGSVDEAQDLFEELPERDVVLWNALVNGYAQIGRLDEVLRVFRAMSKEGFVPSSFTVTGMLSIFAVMGDGDNGRAVHGFAVKMGYDSSVVVLNALIDFYGKCKCSGDASEIFEMIDEKDIVSWNSIISVHVQRGNQGGALRLFERMLGAGVLPDLVTIAMVLPACAHLAALMHGREIHGYMIRNSFAEDCCITNGFENVWLYNALMDMYAKCGNMRNALMVFDNIRNKHVASWNIMIVGYGMHGYGHEALNMFSRMCETQLKPDDVTFVGILSACNHAGLLDQGREFFNQMETKYGMLPTIEHYTCLIDMLGRAGKLEEAYELVRIMPVEANPVVWRALLAACRLQGDADVAKTVAQQVIELEPDHSGSYVLMSNIYGVVGRYEEVLEVRDAMRQQNVKKTPGCSWIELKDGVHTFINGDKSHSDANLIYALLISLTARLREHGYVPHF